MSALLGLDIGTTGCKAVVFDTEGALLAGASREYPVDLPQPGWAEQDLEGVWALAQEAMAEAITRAGTDDIQAIGLSVHGEAVTPLDAAGRPLRPMILGMDTRTDAQNAWLREVLGSEWLFARTGMPVHTVNTLPKLLWLREHEPATWQRAARFVLVEDFVIGRMTGRWMLSDCLASRTQLADLATGTWDPDILGALGLDVARLSEVRPSGTAVGELSAELTARLGLVRAPLIATGGHDQACGALGVGVTRPGLASVSTGTAEVVEVVLDAPALGRPLYEGDISLYRHVTQGRFLAMTLNHSGGLVLRWFRDAFCEAEVQRARDDGGDAYDAILGPAATGPTGLLVLPHFAGSGTPTFDTTSRGAIVGLTFATTRGDVARAILEGLTYELRLNLEVLRAGGVRIDVLRAIGGGARSAAWLQLKADVTGIPVVTPCVTEAAALGAAILAGTAAGCFASAADAAERFLDLTATYSPDVARHEAYSERFELYRELYPAVVPIARRLA